MGRPQQGDRSLHLLIVRVDTGFGWQIRFDRHAVPLRRSERSFSSHAEAQADGQRAMVSMKNDGVA